MSAPPVERHVDELWWGSPGELRALLDADYFGSYIEAPVDDGGGVYMECPLEPGGAHFVHALERRPEHVEFVCSHGCDEERIRARLLDAQALLASAELDPPTEGAAERPHGDDTAACVSARSFIATPRPPLDPYVATKDGKTVLLARETLLLFAGPSGLGKSLAGAFDLAGRLAAGEDTDWIGLRVFSGRRVLLLSFEGSDEDTAERVEVLIPEAARGRFLIWDRWRGPAAPRADEDGLRRLAAQLAEHEIDVLVIDTGSAFFSGAHDCSKGIPEEAIVELERLRELAGRPVAVIVVAHTKKADRTGAKVDELEEIAGTFARKADAAIVMRREGERGPRRRLVFPKTRKGPEPAAKIATLPAEDSEASPRLELMQDLDAPGVKAGTSAEEIAAWIGDQPAVVAPGSILEHFGIGDSTLRDRRGALAELGIAYRQRRGYGTAEQWQAREGSLGDV